MTLVPEQKGPMPPVTWILVDEEKMGARNQCLGLAEALDLVPQVKLITVRWLWRGLPPLFWPRSLWVLTRKARAQLTAPWPQLIIASGRKSIVPAVALKRKTGCRLVLLQNAGVYHKDADLTILPQHDQVTGPRVLSIIGNAHRVTPEKLAQGVAKFPDLKNRTEGCHVVSVLIGGPNKAFDFSFHQIQSVLTVLLERLNEDNRLTCLMTLSRRTPKSVGDMVFSLAHPRLYVWDGKGENPYFALLGLADHFVITADSVAMVSEAAATGKPISIVALPGKSKKFDRFHAQMERRGCTRPFQGSFEPWHYAPLKETERAAEVIRESFGIAGFFESPLVS